MSWADARIGFGRIGFLPIGGRGATGVTVPAIPPTYHTDLPQGIFVVEVRLPSGELLAVLESAFAVGYEELVDGIGQAWASLNIDDSKWPHIAQGRMLVIRERGQRPKVFIIRGIRERRQ